MPEALFGPFGPVLSRPLVWSWEVRKKTLFAGFLTLHNERYRSMGL